MRNLIRMSVLAAMMLIPGCASNAQAGASVSVTVGLGSGYSSCYDDDLDWDNVIVIDNSRVGFWVMLPSGRWVLRCRSMWWNSDYDDWCFGPWYDDYSINYGCHCHDHFRHYCPFHAIRFHVYMYQNYRPWHERHFQHRDGRYIRRHDIRSHDRHYLSRHDVRRSEPVTIHQRGPARVADIQREGRNERPAVIVREDKPPVRIDGGNRPERIENSRQGRGDNGNHGDRIDHNSRMSGRGEMNRPQHGNRESGNSNRSVTRTQTRRDGRHR